MRLQLTRRADYAVRAMLALARQPGKYLSGSRLASEVSIPGHFVTQVMGDLVEAGLVEARTGRTGGYRLAHAADATSMLAVVEAVEGDTRRQVCVLRGGPCRRDGTCAVHEIFSDAQEALLARLEKATLADAAQHGGRPRRGPQFRPPRLPARRSR
jgi:Rrf2 family protein